MSWHEAILLGLVQGLTEFLPVSSSGHLVLTQHLLGLHHQNITFEVFVHFGTLMAVVLVFKADIFKMTISVFGFFKNLSNPKYYFKENSDFKIATYIILASIPAAIVGLFFIDFLENIFSLPFWVSIMLLITGGILLATNLTSTKHSSVKLPDAMVMGLAQAFAIIPGISRSGSTICMAMFMGLNKNEAARFSFLLSLPVIFGATILKFFDLLDQSPKFEQFFPMLIGTFVAFISGYWAIRFLLNLIREGKISYFAYYCFAAGIVGAIYFY